LERVSISGNTKIICKVTLSLGLLSPQILLSGVSIIKEGNFIKPGNEMLKIDVYCTRFKTNYSSITSRSSGNIRSQSGGAKEKGETW
jgi:hypothetical protein